MNLHVLGLVLVLITEKRKPCANENLELCCSSASSSNIALESIFEYILLQSSSNSLSIVKILYESLNRKRVRIYWKI